MGQANAVDPTSVEGTFLLLTVVECAYVDMALSQISEPSCKLQTLQRDLRLAINLSDGVDQPLHVGAAVNEVRL